MSDDRFPHVVDVSVLSICIVLCAFIVGISMCLFYVSLGSRVCWVWCEESACCLVWVEDEVVCPSPCMYFM